MRCSKRNTFFLCELFGNGRFPAGKFNEIAFLVPSNDDARHGQNQLTERACSQAMLTMLS